MALTQTDRDEPESLIRLPWRDPVNVFAAWADEDFALLLHDGCNGRARLFRRPADQIFGHGRAAFDRLAGWYRSGLDGDMAAGLFGYDLASGFERLDLPEPPFASLAFARYPAWAEFDETAGEIRIHGRSREHVHALAEDLVNAPEPIETAVTGEASWQPRWSRNTYLDAARRARDYVHAGDVFQVNLSQAFDINLAHGDEPYAAFERLCRQSPAPHAAYLRLPGNRVVVSNSPERFLSVSSRRVEARPIKGTRPRSIEPSQDQCLADELRLSAKDRAENLMIVDLMRNDISRVCDPGSVAVPMLCGVESYANVHHLVSVVEGKMATDRDSVDLIEACFPPGSITGAPKVRAMEIIAELEGEARGPYCGALGWIHGNGDLDLNVMIRTAWFEKRGENWSGVVRSGGGIVADSDPAAEYEETLTKASALRRALTGQKQ